MTVLRALPADFSATRAELHSVASHILARRRQAVSGRIGLRATVGGIGTPAFGDEYEIVRISGGRLVREMGKTTRVHPLHGSSLRELGAFAEVDLDAALNLGDDPPPLGDVDTALTVDPRSAAALAGWYGFAWEVLDDVLGQLPASAEPSVIQLWPEHFDAAADLAATTGVRLNVGASPGDGFNPEPYMYVGPWGVERPGDPAYWNAPFGAVLDYRSLLSSDAPDRLAVNFVLEGIERLSSPKT